EKETKSIDLGKDKHEGWESKQNAMKALFILNKLLHSRVKINKERLSRNLKRAPNLCNIIGEKWLLTKGSTKKNPHILAYIYQSRLPDEGELDKLRKKWENEQDENKKFKIAMDHNDLLSSYQSQTYWKNVFKIINEHDIELNKKKKDELRNDDNILAEMEILSRLAQQFEHITVDQDVEDKNIDIMIEYEGEKILIEVATVHERDDVLLAHGGISVAGGKVKHTLKGKFDNQLKEGELDTKMPLIIILRLVPPIDFHMAENGIYGEIQSSIRI
ncbi:unnamed protein product, partial [marine sediment metagenome]